ncbi:NEL-type E3 ubiquitin ligase domain-containing protein [Pseudomonas sp. DCB_BI]|uniref:NEL-type E3 ubiquitin ligase domain-containing protein n=1 Tax=Pseudomonas sp. DCB_BI TaxID=2993594 RepID=UPI00224B2240|nr:NEL-type E3 ubiquitin ligase domain-containing protein [Pseudomonas sp. DCB_BI]MCX2891028.1 NEL-type E3 ubiquitin ligase domain-containing protein [Pseudomonas sp. DCB_BI]
MQTDQITTAPDPLVLAQAYQDNLIAKRLPGWLKAASQQELQQLGGAMQRSLETRRNLSKLMARIQGIDTFATSLLESQMLVQFGHEYQVRRWEMLVGNRQVVINTVPVGAHLTEVEYAPIPLVEAALRNFTEAECASDRTREGAQPRGNRLQNRRQGSVTPPSADHFARFCRQVDLGGQYQRHLDAVLQPAAGFDDSTGAPRLLAEAHREALLVDAYQAKLNGQLTQAELHLIVSLCADNTLGRLKGDLVVANRLQLLGFTIQQVVVLAVMDEGLLRNTIKRVLVHIPGDGHGAWCAFESLRTFANALGRRLRDPGYQRFFSRFVRRRDSQAFFGEIIPAYSDLVMTANYDLDEELEPYRMPLFNTLAMARIEQIKDDAAMIAVPVAKLDREVEAAHNRRMAAEGWTLLNLAGLFVPIIGAGLLAVTAWKLLGEVYHGLEAWREGDDNEALRHLINVGGDVAAVAATSAGLLLTRRLWQGATVVDELVPAHLEDGTVKLWNQDLSSFRRAAPGAGAVRDSQGIYRAGEHAWIKLDDGFYAVAQQASTGEWKLVAQHGHAPLLCHNGAGAWRLWSEQPAQWDDTFAMFRRLGGDAQTLEDEQIAHALAAHGMSADHLRAVHVYGQRVDPELMDTVLRIKIDQRIQGAIRDLREGAQVADQVLVEQAQRLLESTTLHGADLADRISVRRRELFQRLYDGAQESDSPGVAFLRRAFTRLHGAAARGLLRAASVADQRLVESGTRIALRLSEAARCSVQRIRVARVIEAYLIESPQDADTARVAVAMLKHLPNAAAGIRWRLLDAGSGADIVLTEGELGSLPRGLLHRAGKFQLLDDQGNAIGTPGELFETMSAAYSLEQRQQLGIADPCAHHLRVLLGRQIQLRRQEVENLFAPQHDANAWFKPVRRLSDGRVGYPLSGRGAAGSSQGPRPQALLAMVRALYPSFTVAQADAWLADIQASGLNLEAELDRQGRELQSLSTALYQWQMQTPMGTERSARRAFREALRGCWQRRITFSRSASDQSQSYRWAVLNLSLPTLPELPARVSFNHVTELALFELGLTSLPERFIEAFPHLRTLELPGNQLTRLPSSLMQIRSLRSLDAFGNHITLDAGQATILSCCESLEYINLSYNPLGRVFSVSGLSRLRHLHMRSTGINDFPNALAIRPDLMLADFRDNQIAAIPEAFYRAPGWVRRSILVRGNPLAEVELQRWDASLGPLGTLQEALTVQPSDARRQWLDACQRARRGEFSLRWDSLQSDPDTSAFLAVLTTLLRSAEFQRAPQALADRVCTMVEAMAEWSSLREEVLSEVTEVNCQDDAALCFSNLEVRMLVWQAQQRSDHPADGLLHLGRQLWRLEQVDRIALEDIRARREAGGNPDEVEVGLAYRLSLRDALDLPAQPSDMLFGEISGVDERRTAAALAQVQDAESPASVATSMVERAFWQRYLQRTQGDRLEALDAPFHSRLGALMDERNVLDGERLEEMNRVRDEREAARRQLMWALTVPMLEEDGAQREADNVELPQSSGASAS